EPGQGDDISSARFLDVLAVICVHLQHAADSLAGTFYAVEYLAARRDDPGIDTDKAQRADKGITHNLEGESGKRLVVGATAHDRLLRADLDAVDRGNIGGGRQIIDHRVEQRLHPFVLKGRTAQHRHKGPTDRSFTDAMLQRALTRLLASEISFERRVVLLDRSLDQFCPGSPGFFHHLGWYLDNVELRTEGLVAPFDGAKAD